MFKKLFLVLLTSILLVHTAHAQTFYSWRQRISASACTSFVDGKPADFCLQQSTPALYVCNNSGSNCTQASHWALLTPFYLSGTTVYTVGNYTAQFGTVGVGTITATSGLGFDGNNDSINDINITSSGGVQFPNLGASSTGTNFVCLNTSGVLVKSTSACSGT